MRKLYFILCAVIMCFMCAGLKCIAAPPDATKAKVTPVIRYERPLDCIAGDKQVYADGVPIGIVTEVRLQAIDVKIPGFKSFGVTKNGYFLADLHMLYYVEADCSGEPYALIQNAVDTENPLGSFNNALEGEIIPCTNSWCDVPFYYISPYDNLFHKILPKSGHNTRDGDCVNYTDASRMLAQKVYPNNREVTKLSKYPLGDITFDCEIPAIIVE
jgi:hypothetical protein